MKINQNCATTHLFLKRLWVWLQWSSLRRGVVSNCSVDRTGSCYDRCQSRTHCVHNLTRFQENSKVKKSCNSPVHTCTAALTSESYNYFLYRMFVMDTFLCNSWFCAFTQQCRSTRWTIRKKIRQIRSEHHTVFGGFYLISNILYESFYQFHWLGKISTDFVTNPRKIRA